MPSCKSQGRKNKTMKKNTKKMQGGKDGENDSNPPPVLPPPVLPPPVLPPLVPQVNPNAPSTTTKPDNSFFGMTLPNFFGTGDNVTKPTTGGKRKSKSNKSYKKKSKYNKK